MKVYLCKGCAEELAEYWPYLVRIEEIEINIVSVEDCDNTTFRELV